MSGNKSEYQWKFEYTGFLALLLLVCLILSRLEISKLERNVSKLTDQLVQIEESYQDSVSSLEFDYDLVYEEAESAGYQEGLSEGFSRGMLSGMFRYRYDGLLVGLTGDYKDDYFYELYLESESDLTFTGWIAEEIALYDSGYSSGYSKGESHRKLGFSRTSCGGPDSLETEDIGYAAGYYNGYLGR